MSDCESAMNHLREDQQVGKNGRPSSIYDNFDDENENLHNGNSKATVVRNCTYRESYTCLDNSPTQAHCLNTTVPQNIAAQSIAGKHTPTRNSLRHSRMIVLNRSGKVPTKYYPVLIKHINFAKSLIVSILLSGIILCLISFWLLIWSPSIRHTDNPYWSAIPILFCGIVSLMFLCFCPKEYPSRKVSCWYVPTKLISILTSVVALLTAFAVCTLNVIHLIMLGAMTCSSPDHLNTSCTCNQSSNSTDTLLSSSFHYVDLTCQEVNDVLSNLLIVSSGINGFVVICLITYLSLHWNSRERIIYKKLRIKEDIFFSKTTKS